MNSIYVIIVLYKIQLEDALAYQTLIKANHIEEFFVYDNSPETFQLTSEIPEKVTYIRDYSNSGLSKAYNVGAQYASKLGYKRILILDQDTEFKREIWNEYLQNIDYEGIMSPILRTTQGKPFSPVDTRGWGLKGWADPVPGDHSLFELAVVNSGCCIPVSLFELAGGYKESVKLDLADFQFQIRVRNLVPHFRLMHSVAIQDFSNDSTDINALLQRNKLYLQSAAAFCPDTTKGKLKHHVQVLRHGLALTLRTHKIQFLTNYLKFFLLKR